MLQTILNQVLPSQCLLCQAKVNQVLPLCAACKDELPWNHQACHHCGKHIESKEQTICGHCITSPPNYDRVFTAFKYETPINAWVSSMKFFDQWQFSKILGLLFAEKLIKTLKPTNHPDLIIPVPLHPKRITKRGFNQALEIAKPISRAFKIPLDYHSIKRIKNTLAQSELDKPTRDRNLKNAFHIRKAIKAKHIAIVDDVATTGNTIQAVTDILKKHGVERVDVWVCTRAHFHY